MKIRAAVFRDDSMTPSIEELELSGPRDGEVLVRITATGVCHTDLKTAGPGGRSPRPVVLGHEGSGVVEAVGSGVTRLVPGDHVVMSFGSCGHCPSCLDAEPAYCYNADHFACARPDGEHYLSADGVPVHGDFFNQSSFVTHTIAKQRGVVKVREDAPLELLGPLGCGVQTGAGAVLNVFRMKPGQTLAVFGAGSLGLSAVMAARLPGQGASSRSIFCRTGCSSASSSAPTRSSRPAAMPSRPGSSTLCPTASTSRSTRPASHR